MQDEYARRIFVGYLSDVKGGPKELQQVRLEICSILSILSIIQDQAEQVKNGDLWSSTLSSLDVPNGPVQQFRTALEQVELKFAPVGGWKKVSKVLTWPFKKDEIQRILSMIERQKLLFTLARQNDHIALTKAIKGDVEAVHEKVNEIGGGVAKLAHSEKHHKIRLWLSEPDPSSNYNRALRKRHGGTGDWLIETDVFRDWKQDPGPSSIVWLYGISGCGISVLCSTLLEHVLDNYAPIPDIAVLYIFFDFNDPDKQQHESVVRSLLNQLTMHWVSVPPVMETLYISCLNGGRKPTFKTLLETPHRMATAFNNTFIILDALDECKERPELLVDIEELISWKDTTLRILATSRSEKDIEDSILHLTKEKSWVRIQSALVDADIRAYVHDQLQTNKKLHRWQKEPKVQMEIEDTLMNKADGMFQWVACQLDSLGSCLTLPKLRNTLATLPRTLNDTYSRVLCNIDEDYQQYALHILQWLAFSVRPLHLEEFAEVIAIDINDSPRIDPQRRLSDPRDVLDICSSLITLTNWPLDDADLEQKLPGTFVSLAHFSIKEYLISEAIHQGQAAKYSLQEIHCHVSLAKDCLAYLLHFDEIGSLSSEVFAEYPLARYIAENWTEDARVAEKIDNRLYQDFFLTKGAFVNWIQLSHSRNLDHLLPSDLRSLRERGAFPLYYASEAGQFESVKTPLGKGADINARDKFHGSALIAASYRGYVEVVQLLPEKGAHVNAKSIYYGTALIQVSDRRFNKIVQLLLENGADVNALRSGRFGSETALLAAIYNRDEELAQLFIGIGADVTLKGRENTSPLETASYKGLQRTVELILNKGVHVEVHGETYSRALVWASRGGNQEIAQILLGKGAVINAEVIESALDRRIMGFLQMLHDHGYDLSLQDAEGRALCHHACAQHKNNIQTLRMLLKLGLDLTVTDKQGRSCLHHAAATENSRYGDPIPILTWLLEKGFDPYLPDRDGWTSLHWAAKGGHAETIGFLEAAGAKFSIENIMGWTPDDVAVYHHHKISWKTNAALVYRVEKNPTLEEGERIADPEADTRGVGGQVFPGKAHESGYCRGCNLVSRFLSTLMTHYPMDWRLGGKMSWQNIKVLYFRNAINFE